MYQADTAITDYDNFFQGKNILVTGSVGTVGSEVFRQLAQLGPATIKLFDNNESGLFFQMNACGPEIECVPILGDIRDHGKLQEAMVGVDMVFHLAAYKHVCLCEANPFDAVRTNVIGTQNVLRAAIGAGIKRVIYTSSDKAVNPTNVMGTSKLLAERVVTAASLQNGGKHKERIFFSTRFGNVLGSNGSVVPIFERQIKQGGPVTVTHADMTRFIMTVEAAAQLVLKSGMIGLGGEVMVTKMPVVRIVDLAKAMIELLAPLHGYEPEQIPIEFIGAKPGEKLYEELMTEEEIPRAMELPDMFVIPPAFHRNNGNGKVYSYPEILSHQVERPYISKTERTMTIPAIKKYLVKNRILTDSDLLRWDNQEKVGNEPKYRYLEARVN